MVMINHEYSETSECGRCPLYGLSFLEEHGVLVSTGTNNCGLITGSNSPCQMELQGQIPDWDECYTRNPESTSLLEKMDDALVFFSDNPGVGIPFLEWEETIMGEE